MSRQTGTPPPDNPSLIKAAHLMAETMPLFRRKTLPIIRHGRCNRPSPVHMAILDLLSKKGPVTMGQLAEMLHTSKPNITMLVGRLESSGLVERRRRDQDRRVMEIAPTRKAVTHRKEVARRMQKNMESVLSGLSPADVDRLAGALETVHNILSKLDDSE